MNLEDDETYSLGRVEPDLHSATKIFEFAYRANSKYVVKKLTVRLYSELTGQIWPKRLPAKKFPLESEFKNYCGTV